MTPLNKILRTFLLTSERSATQDNAGRLALACVVLRSDVKVEYSRAIVPIVPYPAENRQHCHAETPTKQPLNDFFRSFDVNAPDFVTF